jgi:hypothetical protein
MTKLGEIMKKEFAAPTKRLILSWIKFVVFFVLIVGAGITRVQAQAANPTPTPTEEELRLQAEKRLLELKKDIELDKKAIRDAQPAAAPTPSVTALSGDTTISEGARLEAEMVSYQAMSQVAFDISKKLRAKLNNDTGPTIAIYDAQVVKDWRFYRALAPVFSQQVDDILQSYTKILCGTNGLGSKTFRDSSKCPQSGVALESATLLPAVPEAFTAGAGLVKSFIDFTSLFRTDTKIDGKPVTIDQTALVAETFRALQNEFGCVDPLNPGAARHGCTKKEVTLFFPGMFPPRLETATSSTTIGKIGLLFLYKEEADAVLKRLDADKTTKLNSIKDKLDQKSKAETDFERVKALTETRDNLTKAIGIESIPVFRRKLWNERVAVETELKKLKSDDDLEALIHSLEGEINPVKAAIKEIDGQAKVVTQMNDRFQTFADQFVKVDEAKGINMLALFIRAEEIDQIMNDNESYWLEIKSVSAGGNNRTRKNLIWFFAGARLDHSGGAIIEYTLYNKEGAVVDSDKCAFYEGYITPKNIRNGKLVDPVQP